MSASHSTPSSPAVRRLRRAAGILLFAAVCAVTLFALFHAVENWRGQRAWARYEREAAARGDILEFAELVPPEIPDAENFAANPVVDSWFPGLDSAGTDWWPDTYSRAAARIARKKTAERSFTDLVAWKEALTDAVAGIEGTKIKPGARPTNEQHEAAKVVLAELKVYEPALEELRRAMARPGSRYPVHYLVEDPFTILLPHLPKIRGVAQVLNLRACAGLAAGDVAGAYQDTLLALRMAESLREEVFIISQLVRIAVLDQALQPLWEGLARGAWSEAQLQSFQAQLAKMDFVTAFDRSLRSERAAGIAFLQQARKRGFREVMEILGPEQSTVSIFAGEFFRLLPRGWLDMEQVSYCTLLDSQIAKAVNTPAKTIDLVAFEENGRRIEDLLGIGYLEQLRHHRILARLILPSLTRASRRYAAAQVHADQAMTACAIERYRLAHGKLPESLDALAPGFIARVPDDVVSGKPFTYLRTENRFVLQSAGADVPSREEKSKQGEWQWNSAAP